MEFHDTRPDLATVVETHLSMLVLTGDRVYKFRKPVTTGFCDFATVEDRRRDCERELVVNRRLAPEVYLGVGSIGLRGDRPEQAEPCVVMRRLPADRQLSTMLDRGEDVTKELRAVARHVADFHSWTLRSPEIAADGSAEALQKLWRATLADLHGYEGRVLDPVVLRDVTTLAERWLEGRSRLYRSRCRSGHVVDGHGDLRADSIFCLDDGPRVVDAVEFDERLRHVDVAMEVAFLVMDLRRRGRERDAEVFVDAYEEYAGEPLPPAVLEHAVAYWAAVRAKVACLRWEQGSPSAADEARRLLTLAQLTLQAARPRLIAVGGLPGSGKTTLAEGLGVDNGWTVLSSDVVRKELAGLPARASASAAFEGGIYGPRQTAATYRELLRRARASLEMGETVVVDASWTSATWRTAAADIAYATASELVQLRCVVDPAVARARLARRAAVGDVSDADATIARLLAERFDPWPEATVLDTTGPPSATVRDVTARVA